MFKIIRSGNAESSKFIAIEDFDTIGSVCVDKNSNNSFEIYNLLILSKFRKLGYGKKLLNKIISFIDFSPLEFSISPYSRNHLSLKELTSWYIKCLKELGYTKFQLKRQYVSWKSDYIYNLKAERS